MPSLEVSIPHTLPVEAATERVRSWFDSLVEQHRSEVQQVDVAWNHAGAVFSLHAQGLTVSGRVEIAVRQVAIHAKIPFVALVYKSRIQGFLLGSLGRELED
jgi:hypothetical protein